VSAVRCALQVWPPSPRPLRFRAYWTEGRDVVTIFVADDLEPWNTGVKVSWADVGDRILQAARRSP